MEQSELLRYVTELLERLGIEHMLVGSIASMAYGESRFTLDIDIVVDLDQSKVNELCASFPESDFYVSQSAVEEALKSRRQFNVIHPKSGLKIDFMIVRETEWGRHQLSRRRLVQILPNQLGYTAAPEDVILGKLLYYKEGKSEKHLRDIAGMLNITDQSIDLDDITLWATKLGVNEIWQSILQQRRSNSSE